MKGCILNAYSKIRLDYIVIDKYTIKTYVQ